MTFEANGIFLLKFGTDIMPFEDSPLSIFLIPCLEYTNTSSENF
jgi:hypothetical protein